MKHFKILIAVVLGAVLLFTSCPTPESTDVATVTIENKSSDDNITVHFGDYNESDFSGSIPQASSSEIAKDTTVTFLDCPLDKAVNIWCTYETNNEDGAITTNYIRFTTSDPDVLFEQLFEAGEAYNLIINDDTFELIHDGINLVDPDATNPATTEPEATDPEEPETTEPETDPEEPETTEPEATDPATTEPEPEPDVTAPVVTINFLDPLGEDSITYYSPLSYELLVTENSNNYTPYIKNITIENGTINGSICKDLYYEGEGDCYKISITPITAGDVNFTLAADTFSDAAGNKNAVTTCQTTVNYKPLGAISEIAPTSDSNWVYAVDYDNVQMLLIDVENEKIDSVIELPNPNPVSIKFSEPDNMLYIAYAFRDCISRYDLDTKSFIDELDYNTSDSSHTLEIEIAPIARKIYCLSPAESKYEGELTIIDMDDATVLASGPVGGTMIAVTDSGSTNHILIGNEGVSAATLSQYIQSDAEITEVKNSRDYGSNGQYLVVSPNNTHLIFATGSGNGDYTMFDIDPSDIDSYAGEWNCGAYPEFAAFSPDNEYVYTWGDGLSKFNTNYIKLNTFKTSDSNTTLFSTNSDGSKLIVFSYDVYDDEYRFYFYNTSILN